jgi:SAM-dependent methyltransferase
LNKHGLFSLSPALYEVADRLYERTSLAARRRRDAGARAAQSAALRGQAEAAALSRHFDQPAMVQAGPFSGMKYLEVPQFSRHGAKILGTYEAEIHCWIDRLRQVDVSSVINIGCAEGYYAVGLAREFPNAKVIAVDINASVEKYLRMLAESNGVEDQVEFRTQFSVEQIAKELTLLFVDIEGAEKDFFHSGNVNHFVNCIILIELHEQFRPGVEVYLNRLFYPTHAISTIRPLATPLLDPRLRLLMGKDEVLLRAITEDRGPLTGWSLFWPYSRNESSLTELP